MNAPENILLIRLKSIGDILFTLPAVNAVRDNFPEARISFLVSKEHAPLLEGFRDVNEVIALDRAPFHRKQIGAMCAEALGLMRRLLRGRFSLVIDLHGFGETALLTWLTRAPQRWGHVYHKLRSWAYTRPVPRNDRQHPVEGNLSLLAQCGLQSAAVRNEFHLSENHVQSARAFFAENGCDPAKPTLYIQPFTSSPQKNWPLDNHLSLAMHWRSQGLQIIFGGSAAERDALGRASRAGFPVSAGVPLLTTAGLMKFSTFVVGGDTGVLHLAVAMGKRVVMVMSSTKPGSTYPFGHADWAVTPQNPQSVAGINVDAVIQASAKAFAEMGLNLPAPNPHNR